MKEDVFLYWRKGVIMKNKYVAAFLALFFGYLGIHKFYLGQIFKGVLYVIFSATGIPFIISIIEFFMLITMDENVFNAKFNGMRFQEEINIVLPDGTYVASGRRANKRKDHYSSPKYSETKQQKKIFCPSCGEKNSSSASFCYNCSHDLRKAKNMEDNISEKDYCSACGKPIEKGATFCIHCGNMANI
jgi:TM2 domain-containing membrane protein YozV/RNA polymerase-binding transcription factor DksA